MTNYYRVWLGQQSAFADECKEGSFIGVDYGIYQDLTNDLPERWQEFNEKFRPVWLDQHPGKSKISAGLSCGALHTVVGGSSKKLLIEDPRQLKGSGIVVDCEEKVITENGA